MGKLSIIIPNNVVCVSQKTIFIYGLGATIEKAVKLALKLQDIFCGVTFDVKTSTVKLIDDVSEEKDGQTEVCIKIKNSIIIYIYRRILRKL